MITAKLSQRDAARFSASLQKMAALSGEPIEDILRKQGRLAAVQLARFTKRVGNTQATGKFQKEDVVNTIARIYIDPGKIAKVINLRHGKGAAGRFRGFIRSRNSAAAEQMITSMHLVESRHQINVGMFDNGNRHTRWLKGKGKSVLVVMDYRSTVPKYRRKKVANVGALKAGWAKAAEDLGGTKGIPPYARKGHKTRGHGSVVGKGGKATLIISNRSDYIIQNRTLTDVFRVQSENMEKIMKNMLKRRVKKITKKT